MKKLNLKNVKLKSIDGKEIENVELHKLVAQLIYTSVATKNIWLVDKALKLFNEGVIEVDANELKEIRELSLSARFPAFIRKALRDIFDEMKK